jgi:hypothetical protein
MIIATHIPSGNKFELTGSVYRRDENDTLLMCVSYLNQDGTSDSNEFPVNEETGEIIHSDYSISYT